MGPVQAQAATYPSTEWYVSNYAYGYGHFIWYNRSVQVGGSVFADGTGDPCAAVVLTAYDQYKKQVARAARPGDNEYSCDTGAAGFGFTLDASDVVGGIRSIEVDLWEWDFRTGRTFKADTEWYYRP